MSRSTRRKALIVSLFLAVAANAFAFLQDGNQLFAAMREFEKAEASDPKTDYLLAWKYVGYVIGVCDATENEYQLPEKLTGRQVCYVVAAWLKAHPERWGDPASDLVREAIATTFTKAKVAP